MAKSVLDYYSHKINSDYEKYGMSGALLRQKMHFKKRSSGSGGFTLVEVLVAVSLLTMCAGGALWTLTQANNYAALSRLYTGAQVLAQNQIDLVMSKSPFNPQNGQVPSVLGGPDPLPVGGSKITTELPDPVKPNLTIYAEPDLGSGEREPLLLQADQRVTTVTDTNKFVNGRNLNLYRITVLVKFSFRGKQHQVQLNAMRASDVDGNS